MRSNQKCAEYFKSQEAYRRCFEELWKKWRSYGRVAGRITLRDASEEERRAIGGIIGKVFYGEDIRFSVSEFEAGLQKTRFAPVDLKELLELYFGETLCSRAEQQEAAEKLKASFWKGLQESVLVQNGCESAAYAWFAEMLEQRKYGYLILNREYGKDPRQAKVLACHITEALQKLEDEKQQESFEVPLAVFASDISGNPHYFDRGTTAGMLLTQAVCWFEKAEVPENSYTWRELMQRVGILPDNLSSMLHAYGLQLCLGEKLHPAYDAFCQLHQACVITMENLRKVTAAEPLGKCVYIVENEMVFSYLVEHLNRSSYQKAGGKAYRYTLLCTSGQPRAAAQQLISLLLKSGVSICYSGDIDPDGIGIADRLWQKFGDSIRIWRMSPEDYEKSRSAEQITAAGRAKLEHIAHPLLRRTAGCVKEEGLAGYQENLLEELLGDVRDSAFAGEEKE
ncbi:MAG: TIGR02679 family protein [Lachnospiraceae bacterium]|nr:TIGR02679 family protein [Lachnospiraceae bacterium]